MARHIYSDDDTQNPLSQGIGEAYRQLREALFVMATVKPTDSATMHAVDTAKAVSEAVLPILIALTGREQQVLIDACVARLQREHRL